MREGTERIKGGLLITPQEIEMITGMDVIAAEKEHKYIRKVLGTGSEDLMVKQYCEFHDLDYREIVSFLNPMRPEDEDNNLLEEIEHPSFLEFNQNN